MYELDGNEGLARLLAATADPARSPGAIAVGSIVTALAAAIGGAGDSDGLDHGWLDRADAALRAGDDDSRAYWASDERALGETPHVARAHALSVARATNRVRTGNHADLDTAALLAVASAAAAARVIAQNKPHRAEAVPTEPSLLAPASAFDARPLLTVARASGCYVIDDEGNEWFDGASGMWNVPLGHGNPQITAAWLTQAVQVAAVDPFVTSTAIAENVARTLVRILKMKHGRVIFASSGSESIEAALRVGLNISPDAPVWSMPGAFHGATAGAAALSAFRTIWGPLPSQALWPTSAAPTEWEAPGIGFVEPVQIGRGGLPISPQEVEAINSFQRRGGIVIADEVASGLGRADWPVAAPSIGLSPDMYVLGKGLANGLAPVSALVVSAGIAEKMILKDTLDFGHTHSNHPAGLAASAATLSALSQVDFAVQTSLIADAFASKAIPLRGTGFLLTTPGTPRPRANLLSGLREARLISHSPTTATTIDQLTIVPPLTITADEAADLASRVLAVRRALGW